MIHSRSREAGFTLIEMSISLLVTTVLILGVLAIFDFANRLSRAQTNVSDMQQSQRVSLQSAVRLLRMAGRGGLPLGTMPNGLALSVRNNVPAGTLIGGPQTPPVVAGSDVVTVRGVFSAPLWQINASDPASFTLTLSAGVPVAGTVRIGPTTPTGILQDREVLRQAILNPVPVPEALVLVSPRDVSIYAVVELDRATSVVGGPTDGWTIGFRITGGTYTASYLPLSSGGGWPAALTSAAFVGRLEEHRFYVRDAREGSDFAPRFSRARVFPGTQEPWRKDNLPKPWEHESWSEDIADNILDLQVALGFDTALGGGAMTDDEGDGGDDDRIFESADGRDDDWLFNDTQPFNPLLWNGRQLYFVRLSVLARTDRRDPKYESFRIRQIEDHNLTAENLNLRTERMYRRRLLQTVIDVRNLG